MVASPEYSLQTQSKIVHALCVTHNFIRIHDPNDYDGAILEELARAETAPEASDFGGSITTAERDAAAARRDRIAKAMWEDYVAYMEANHQLLAKECIKLDVQANGR